MAEPPDAATEDTRAVSDVPMPPDVFVVVDAGDDVFDAEPACVPFRSRAELASLGVYIVLDASGSMLETTSAGVSKAEAVDRALEAFLTAPASSGIAVALSFFPRISEGVPLVCSEDSDCGAEPGLCPLVSVCDLDRQACTDDSTCPGGSCVPLGRCPERRLFSPCVPVGSVCAGGDMCVHTGFCNNHVSCDVDDYLPAVDFSLLPGAAPRLVRTLDGYLRDGGTPTLPAITAALDLARERGVESPGSRFITVLATDGFPTNCIESDEPDPEPGYEITQVADVLTEGARDGVATFVVGVFSPDEELEARANLQELAVAGDSEEALVIRTDDDVTERLLEALNAIRNEVQTCVYGIPAEGALPDPRDLAVTLRTSDGPVDIDRVEKEEDCVPDRGGFYFPQDIDRVARPGYIELCTHSCEVASQPGNSVVMQAGCRD